MDSLNPSVLLDRSRTHTFAAQTGSIGVEFLEIGAGIGKMSGRTGYVPWPIQVAGLNLSAVPLQASYHGKTSWQLNTSNIRLAEAFITFNGIIVYGFLCSTAPLKMSVPYQQLLHALSLLSRLVPEAWGVYNWLKGRGDSNSIELRAEGAVCGGRTAHRDWDFRDSFSWSTPQAAVGFTCISFAALEPLRMLLNGVRAVRQAGDFVEDLADDIWHGVRSIF